MAGEWVTATLGQVVEIQTGKLDSNQADANGTYPFFTCAPEPLRINQFAFDCDAILLAGNNANGVFHLNRYCGKFNAYQRTYVITPKKAGVVDIRFLFYLLHTLTRRLSAYSQGTATKFLTMRILAPLPIPLPPIAEQRTIAHILGALDDKIDLNWRMNETLEAMARAIFKAWFVDFDPVRAKAEGRDPGLPKQIADLFPDRFEDSELGEIPAGWEVGPILKQAKLLSGGTPKTDHKEYWDGDIIWASAKDVSQCGQTFLIGTERGITQKGLDESATQLIPVFCVVLVARGATTGRMVMFGREMAMNQTCYALESTTHTPFSLYGRLRHEMDNLVHTAHGSVFDTITTTTFANSKVVLPPVSLLKVFDQKVSPMFHRILGNTEETQTLAGLRDALLLKVLSAEVKIGGDSVSEIVEHHEQRY
jgi:type I restriction enzyme S subunit